MAASKSQQLWTAVVTGGASGIGAAVSRKLASRGINVLIADISKGLGDKLAEELKSEHKVDAAFLRVDVSKEADVRNMIETVVQKWGRLDYAANVAGICESIQFEEHSITTDVVDRTFAINQRGVWLCQKLEAEQMMTQEPRAVDVYPAPTDIIKPQRGSIVNIASTTAVVGMGFAAYAPTKHAVIGITQNGALFYGRYGIRCNSVAPGGTLTPMMKANLPEKYRGTDAYKDEKCELVQCIALKTLAVPEEQASVVSFLLGSDSSHVTGVNIMVDGGFTFTRPDYVS